MNEYASICSVGDLKTVRLPHTLISGGYEAEAVDRLLARIIATLEHPDRSDRVTARQVRAMTLPIVRLGLGYDVDRTDDLLDRCQTLLPA